MALKQPLMILCVVIALLSGTALIYELEQWHNTRNYNSAIQEGEFVKAGDQFKNPQGLFAKAYGEQQQGHFQEARILYAKLEKVNNESLRSNAMFNMANTYMQQAAAEDQEKDADRAMPLVELAKTTYRKILNNDSHHWGAKYNLERALQILPDASEFISYKVEGMRRAVRTVLTSDTEDNLP